MTIEEIKSITFKQACTIISMEGLDRYCLDRYYEDEEEGEVYKAAAIRQAKEHKLQELGIL